MSSFLLPTIEEWSAGKDKFRVAAGGFSRPFPLSARVISHMPLVRFHEANVGPRLTTILNKHDISFSSISMRRMPGIDFIDNPDNSADLRTLLIQTRSEDTSNWKIAAEEISALYADGGFGKDQIEVEIRNPSLMAWYASDSLGDNAVVLAACQSMKPELLDEIRFHCGSAWSSVAFHLRNHVSYQAKRKRPTVIVYCHKGSRCDFDALESALLEIISKANTEFYLELLPGSVISANSPLNEPKIIWDLSEQAFNGASIGLKGDTERSGTLGGWFMLNLQGSLPSKVALTSYNLFSKRGSRGSPQTDLTGLNFKEASEIERLEVEYPAYSDTMATIKHLEALCLKPECPSYIHQKLKDFRDASTAPPIGNIIAASGHRLNECRHRMDWVLFQVSGCIAENRPPPADCLEYQSYPEFGPQGYRVTQDSIITNISEVIPGSWVVKRGKTTGVTSGYINRMPRIIQWEDQQESEEVDVVGLIQDFVQEGDSGSFVVDEFGNLVGLLIATDRVTSCAFVTPIGEILADVKTITGGNLTIT